MQEIPHHVQFLNFIALLSTLLFTNDLVENLCTQGYHLIDNFLPDTDAEQLRAIAQTLHQQGSFQHAKIGRAIKTQHNISIRTDEICGLINTKSNRV